MKLDQIMNEEKKDQIKNDKSYTVSVYEYADMIYS